MKILRTGIVDGESQVWLLRRSRGWVLIAKTEHKALEKLLNRMCANFVGESKNWLYWVSK